MSTEKQILTLENAIVDLLSGIQLGETRLGDTIEAVNEAIDKVPNWRVEVSEE